MKDIDLDKRIHTISARFFGIEQMNEPEILEYIQKIKDVCVSSFDKRLSKLEKVVLKKIRHYDNTGIEVRPNYKHKCGDRCK